MTLSVDKARKVALVPTRVVHEVRKLGGDVDAEARHVLLAHVVIGG